MQADTEKRLKISNSTQFLKVLNSDVSDEAYNKLLVYGRKILNKKGADIPFEDKEMIINLAIAKTSAAYEANKGANVLTFFTSKLRGEVSHYRSKRDAMIRKLKKITDNSKDDYEITYSEDHGANVIEYVDHESTEDKILKEDLYYRQMQAFRMAFSTLPMEHQRFLRLIMDSSLANVSRTHGIPIDLVRKRRNYAVSLIFQKVIRSKHLDEEEKEAIKKEHEII